KSDKMNLNLRSFYLFAVLATVIVSCKTLEKNPGVTGAGDLPAPTPQQVAWQELEYYMFIHFVPNTFTDLEWGHVNEDPKVFAPRDLEPRQLVRIAKRVAMIGITITYKYNDGFCL